jgi:hypothetical protein
MKLSEYMWLVKVKLPLCLTNSVLCHEDLRGSGYIDLVFLTSALVWGEWSASRPSRFTPAEKAPCINWIWGWVSPRAGVDDEKRKLILLGLELQPRSPAAHRLCYLSIKMDLKEIWWEDMNWTDVIQGNLVVSSWEYSKVFRFYKVHITKVSVLHNLSTPYIIINGTA